MPTLNTGRERTFSWAFEKPGQESSQLMNLVNLPMKSAVATKKMLKQIAPGKASRVDELKKKVRDTVTVIKIDNAPPPSPAEKGKENEDADGDAAAQDVDMTCPSAEKKRKAFDCAEATDDGEADGLQGEDAQQHAAKRSKVAQKRSQFAGYSSGEKACYSCLVKGEEDGDTRSCTALDEVLQALKYASYYLDFNEAGDDLSKIPAMLTASFDTLMKPGRLASFSFCMGIFLEFLFQGKVCVNGTDCRAYSTLRVELQNILIKCNESFSVEVTETDVKHKGKSSTSKRGHTALELAELLCSTYMSTPATSVDFGDAEDVDEEDSQR